MALSNQGVVVCNGYKDRAYIRLALIGLKMGLNLYLVIEKPLELELIIEEAARLNIKPQLGLRFGYPASVPENGKTVAAKNPNSVSMLMKCCN